MINVEVDFRIVTPQDDGSDRYAHDTKGWAKGSLPRDLVTLVRENTNIRDEIEIIAWRRI